MTRLQPKVTEVVATINDLSQVAHGSTASTCLGRPARGAQDTLVSQAYGEEDDKKARDYLHCCLVWMLLFAAAASVLLWQTEAGCTLNPKFQPRP